jgi:protein-tyrosine phosphatase
MADIHWVDPALGRLAILGRPEGGPGLERSVREWKMSGVDVVVSLLTHAEERELLLADERESVEGLRMKFVSFPIADGGAPDSMDAAREVVGRLAESLKAGRAIGLHCRAGIGRSPMVAAAVLGAAGVPVDQALRALAEARARPVPETEAQLGWLLNFMKSP